RMGGALPRRALWHGRGTPDLGDVTGSALRTAESCIPGLGTTKLTTYVVFDIIAKCAVTARCLVEVGWRYCLLVTACQPKEAQKTVTDQPALWLFCPALALQ